ncbi:helix-turn-helix domain-containing protein [Alistipes indistinctus]|jgi:hypothetical protein|uniref:helix-turn-helix domain-containing protein n=1 Tax=Alistipes indistinctus TaxID=626932 RepID=UPI00349EDCD3
MPRGIKQIPTAPPRPGKVFYSRKEAAEYLGVSVTTLDRYAKSGAISFKVRRRCHPVYHIADLDRFNQPQEIYEVARRERC